jgi:hypothetical protein
MQGLFGQFIALRRYRGAAKDRCLVAKESARRGGRGFAIGPEAGSRGRFGRNSVESKGFCPVNGTGLDRYDTIASIMR